MGSIPSGCSEGQTRWTGGCAGSTWDEVLQVGLGSTVMITVPRTRCAGNARFGWERPSSTYDGPSPRLPGAGCGNRRMRSAPWKLRQGVACNTKTYPGAGALSRKMLCGWGGVRGDGIYPHGTGEFRTGTIITAPRREGPHPRLGAPRKTASFNGADRRARDSHRDPRA